MRSIRVQTCSSDNGALYFYLKWRGSTLPLYFVGLGLPALLLALSLREGTVTFGCGMFCGLMVTGTLIALPLDRWLARTGRYPQDAPQQFTLAQDGLVVEEQNQRMTVPWPRVLRVGRMPEHMFVQVEMPVAARWFVIPCRYFAAEGEANVFFDELSQRSRRPGP